MYKLVQINTCALRRPLVSDRPSTPQGTDRRNEDIWLTADQRLALFFARKPFLNLFRTKLPTVYSIVSRKRFIRSNSTEECVEGIITAGMHVSGYAA